MVNEDNKQTEGQAAPEDITVPQPAEEPAVQTEQPISAEPASEDATQTQFEARKPKIAFQLLVGVLVSIIVICLVLAAFVLSKINKITRAAASTEPHATLVIPGVDTPGAEPAETEPPETTEPEPTEPDYGKLGKVVNVLVIGQDARPGEDSKIADTMILLTVNKETKVLTMTSFLRDTKVSVPDYYYDINGNYHFGATKMNLWFALGYSWGGDLSAMHVLDHVIEWNFGPVVDHNIEIDFDAFDLIINAVGGVTVDLDADELAYMEQEFKDYPKYVFHEGPCKLDGWSAEVYARMRHATYGDNDFNRTDRQREVIASLVDKCRNMSLLEANQIIDEVLPMVVTDMDVGDITTYVTELLPLLPELTIESMQCPSKEMDRGGALEDLFGDGIEHSVIYFNRAKAKEILIPITEYDVLQAAREAEQEAEIADENGTVTEAQSG